MASSVDCRPDSLAVRPTVGLLVVQAARAAGPAVAPWAAPANEAAVVVSLARAERAVQLADVAAVPAVPVEQPSRAAVPAGAEPQVAAAAEAAAWLPAGEPAADA